MTSHHGCAGAGLRRPRLIAGRRPPAAGAGQSTLEYALFIAVVAAALTAMGPYIQRAVQANLKQLEDQINVGAALQVPAPEAPAAVSIDQAEPSSQPTGGPSDPRGPQNEPEQRDPGPGFGGRPGEG